MVLLASSLASAQPARSERAQPRPAAPALSASRAVMAGSMLSVSVTRPPESARLAIARSDDPAARAIVVQALPAGARATLPVPGMAGTYELRLTRDRAGAVEVLARQPLEATPATATVSTLSRVGRGAPLPARAIGPNGEQDRVVLVRKDAPAEASGPAFFPAENVEATLEAPDEPGDYELRYVMHAPLAEHRILARAAVSVE